MQRRQKLPGPPPSFWDAFVDTVIPAVVKERYSPDARWKGRPFSQADARFFTKGVVELSELFTEDRSEAFKKNPNYFSHPRFRSSYLLYFLPLQAAKIVTLFETHHNARKALFQKSKIRILDVGSGPGTGSLAVLLAALQAFTSKKGEDFPEFELHWLDATGAILDDGRALLEGIKKALKDRHAGFEPKITLHTSVGAWPKTLKSVLSAQAEPFDLILFANVLNESKAKIPELEALFRGERQSSVLFLEPAARAPSQLLSQLRDGFYEDGLLPTEAPTLWGPCLHAGRCPLAVGRDWCHTSIHRPVSGKWFKQFSRALGSERQWMKFSYLWIRASEDRKGSFRSDQKRVISDPLNTNPPTVLLCAPEQPERLALRGARKLYRGDLLDTSK